MEVSGRGSRRILFVDEAPREQEDRQGRQLVGESGLLLQELLDGISSGGADIEECWSTSALICSPPNGKVTSDQVECCRPNLLKTITELKPNVIIPLGKNAVDALLAPLWRKGIGGISRWVGWSLPLLSYGAWVCPIVHPRDILKLKDAELLTRITRQHLLSALELERQPINVAPLDELKSQVDILQDERQVKRRLRELSQKKGCVAFDYETTGLKPERSEQEIVSCSFCFEAEDTFAFMMTKDIQKRVSKILRNPNLKKIASNLKFEERWTLAKMGHPVANWWWDTMLAAHVLDNRTGITSIKFQTFVQLGIGDYSSHIEDYLKSENANGLNHIRELDEKDLLMYNGLDSLVEFLVAEKQREILCQE